VFDKAAESAVFMQIMNTFGWTTAPVTPAFTPIATSTPISGSGTVVPSPNIKQLSMIDGINGWAIGDPYVLVTRDGGTTWYNMTMTGNVGMIISGFFPNINTAWVITNFAGNQYRVAIPHHERRSELDKVRCPVQQRQTPIPG
jgi:hypothetical protein